MTFLTQGEEASWFQPAKQPADVGIVSRHHCHALAASISSHAARCLRTCVTHSHRTHCCIVGQNMNERMLRCRHVCVRTYAHWQNTPHEYVVRSTPPLHNGSLPCTAAKAGPSPRSAKALPAFVGMEVRQDCRICALENKRASSLASHEITPQTHQQPPHQPMRPSINQNNIAALQRTAAWCPQPAYAHSHPPFVNTTSLAVRCRAASHHTLEKRIQRRAQQWRLRRHCRRPRHRLATVRQHRIFDSISRKCNGVAD